MATPDTVFMARLEFRGYTLTACGLTEDAAKKAVLAALRKTCADNGGRVSTREGDMSAAKYWEYAGGNVNEMALGKCEWL